MNIKDIARRYDMDEKALTARLTKLQTGYKAKQKEYDELLDKQAYDKLAVRIMTLAFNLADALGNAPDHVKQYMGVNDRLEAEIENLYFNARHMTARVSGKKPNFHRNWLALRLLQTFKALSHHPPTKDRLTDFMSDVCYLWGIDPKGLGSVITELRKQGIQ